MQIRYKITITYAITVAVILLLLCCSIYFLSAQDRVIQFRERMKARALATSRLLQTEKLDPQLVKKFSQFPSAALKKKSIRIYNKSHQLIFADDDPTAPPLYITSRELKKVKKGADYFFHSDKRDGIAFYSGENIVVIAAYDDDRVDWLSKLRLILLLSFFISTALVIVIGYIFSLGLVRSISKISDRVKDISSRDMFLRLEVGKNKDELNELAVTINNLLSRLQHSFETQSRFIDNASHELSTPLAVILSQLDIAKQKNRSKEEYEELVDSVYEDVSRLDLLVKSLLDLAKLSGSQTGLELYHFRIDDLLMQLPVNMRKINATYKVKLIFEEFPDDEEDMKVYGNEALLFCAFHNIVHNACKYSPDHAAIVKLSFVKTNIRIVVQDYGPGIREEDLPHIFQPFYRSVNVNVTVQGTGLGLALAKNIIKLHNGSITINTEKGVGTSFLIELKNKTA